MYCRQRCVVLSSGKRKRKSFGKIKEVFFLFNEFSLFFGGASAPPPMRDKVEGKLHVFSLRKFGGVCIAE